MVNIVEHGDAVWIRIAWGKRHSPPNQQRASFAVYYPQTPYVFMANLAAQFRVYVSQVRSILPINWITLESAALTPIFIPV